MNLYLLLYFILFLITVVVLYRKQKRTPYLKIGWFFNLLTFAYYGFPLTYVIFWPDDAYHSLNRRYSDVFLNEVSLILLLCQLSFFLPEIFTLNYSHKWRKWEELKPISSKYILSLLFLIYIMFFYRWSSVGGFLMIITQTRVEYMNDVGENSSILSRYDIIFYIVSVFVIYNICLVDSYIKKNKALIFFYVFFLMLTIFMGTRLILFTTIIGFFSAVFLLKKELIMKYKKKIFLGGFVLFIGFTAFATLRVQLTSFLATGRIDSSEKVVFIPTELFTGLLSHHSIENGVSIDGMTFFDRLLPNTISTFLGLKPTIPYTQQIALDSFYTSGRAVYTVPYLTDIYFNVDKNLFVFTIFSMSFYIIFNVMQSVFYKRNILFLILLYVLIYYVLRVESPVWFGRLYSSFIVLYFILFFLGKKKYLKN